MGREGSGVSYVSYARSYAERCHQGQVYGKNLPYLYHLDDVASLLAGQGVFCQTLAFLHDVLEDAADLQEMRKMEILALFGERVLSGLEILTDPEGETRREWKRKFYERIEELLNEKDSPSPFLLDVLSVKVADRISNIRHSVREGNRSKIRMYEREKGDFSLLLLPEVVSRFEDSQICYVSR